MVSYRPPTDADLETLAATGAGDEWGFTPEELVSLLKANLGFSLETRTYIIGGEAVCVMGLLAESIIGDECHIWMFSLPAVERHKVAFARHVPKLLANLPYSSVTCLCDPAFERTCRWLSRAGFVKVGEATIKGRPFHKLERKL